MGKQTFTWLFFAKIALSPEIIAIFAEKFDVETYNLKKLTL